jgi:hypothetical protein
MDESLRKKRRMLQHLSDLEYALEPFGRLDLKEIIRMIRDLRMEISQYSFPSSLKAVSGYDRKVSLVGLLAVMLMSKEMFKTHKSLINFSNDVLGVKLQPLSRPSRTRIIGEVLSEVVNIPTKEQSRVLDKLQDTIRNKLVHTKTDFFLEWDSAIRRMRSEGAEPKP